MICHKCGQENKPGDKFCSKCNAVLDYHELDVGKIDISGLSLEGDDEASNNAERQSGGKRTSVIIAVVLVLLGIGAAFVVPEYMAQLKAATVLEAITSARLGVENYVKKNRTWPQSEDDIEGIPAHLEPEVGIKINKSVIKLTLPEEPGLTATISASVKNGRIVWSCDNGGIDRKYLPIGCYKE